MFSSSGRWGGKREDEGRWLSKSCLSVMCEEWRGDTKCFPDHRLCVWLTSHSYTASLARHPALNIVLLFFSFSLLLPKSSTQTKPLSLRLHKHIYVKTSKRKRGWLGFFCCNMAVHDMLACHTRWNVFKSFGWIYLRHPSDNEPLESVAKGRQNLEGDWAK